MTSIYHPFGGMNVALNDRLITGGGIEGTSPRVRVDVGQTGFFAKREFRTFREWSDPGGTEIAAGTSYVLKVVTPINLILMGLTVFIDNGQVQIQTAVGGTEGGSFSEILPLIARNNMTEAPATGVSGISITGGGTHTGGTILDVLRIKVENQTGAASSVGMGQTDERGVAPGTYYIRVNNIGAGIVEGVFHARWEERP